MTKVLKILDPPLASGVFQETGVAGKYVLTHNAEKLNNHEYYMAGRAFAFSLVFGGDPPSVMSPSIYSRPLQFTAVGYEKTTPSVDEVPYASHRDILNKVGIPAYFITLYTII